MEILGKILTIVFVINSILLVLIIMLQSNRSSGMGILGGGGSNTAFGSSSADVMTKITGILATIFIVLALSIAFIKSKSHSVEGIKNKLKQEIQLKEAKQKDTSSTIKKEDKKTDTKVEKDSTKKKEPATSKKP